MLPSVLRAASFSLPVEWPLTIKPIYSSVAASTKFGGSAAPWQYAIEVWGDPPQLRGYPWNGRALPVPTNILPIPTPTLKEVNQEKSAPVAPRASEEEVIKLYESLIVELKARGGSEEVIERLQRDVDERKKARKK